MDLRLTCGELRRGSAVCRAGRATPWTGQRPGPGGPRMPTRWRRRLRRGRWSPRGAAARPVGRCRHEVGAVVLVACRGGASAARSRLPAERALPSLHRVPPTDRGRDAHRP
ncbi:hypothetical protein QJS66_09365 [Kocuria rhizophila]|nr:hypothetical protein QJS66_09365 [Kocuria rhizophila]